MKGEVIINPDTFDINRFFDLESVFVGHTEDTTETMIVETVRIQKTRPVVKFASIDSRDDAETLLNKNMYVDENQRIVLPEGHFFIHDLIGMSVYTIDDKFVGKVKDVLQLPAHNVYVIKYNEKEVMVPAVEEFIDLIDTENEIIRIKPIEGLLE